MIVEVSMIDIINQQRDFFQTGETQKLSFRISQLKLLQQLIKENETVICQALKADLNKPEFEAFSSEILLVFKEIEFCLKNLKNWIKPQKTKVPWQLLPASAKIYPEPLGVVLIIGTWNYPFQLVITPLIGAIASGNCTIIKPSEIAPNTSSLIAKLISKYFQPEYIKVIEGGVETSQKLLAEKFDHIFFTGGTAVAKIVMAAAAQHLTPVTLELGGKNPCIVDTDIHIQHTARRITWGKFINNGQTCLAPDYLLVNTKIKEKLLVEIKKCIQEFYSDNPAFSSDYGRIVNQKQFDKITNLLNGSKILFGGETNREQLYISPTLVENSSFAEPIMQEEIFGPILSIIEYTDISEAIALINSQPKPLALYLFSHNKNLQQRVLHTTSSGTACLNETVMHIGVSSLPFGGVGDSGIGSYHGKFSFDTFSHHKSVLSNPFWLDLKWRYAPYTKGKLSFLKRILGYY
ncbi:aldehyde dehydrogenase [Mastigocladus laminosus UU774]|nr:aldehyde dehydrogenase [Mastigocladus laminosus UU774]